MENNYLYHYGVKGMKWGVRKGRVDQAYDRASRKLIQLDNRINRAQQRLTRTQRIRNSKIRKTANFLSGSSQQYWDNERELYRLEKNAIRKINRSIKKADKWYKSMEETFKGTSIRLSKEQQDMGRRYSEMLLAQKKKTSVSH